jgi:dienelactone hydrolase
VIEQRTVVGVGGVDIPIDRFEPQSGARGAAIMVLHGSGGLRNGVGRFREYAKPVTAAGVSVYVPHYFERTGTNWSDPATSRRNFPVWLEAVGAALAHVTEQPKVDPNRVGVVGFSLGAFLALSLAAIDDRVSAVVDYFGGLPDEVATRARRFPPTLVLHGEADEIVPVSEAHKLRTFLEARGVPHEIKLYPREGHAFSMLAALDAGRRTLAFLARHLATS